MLTSATSIATSTTVAGALNSTPNSQFTIEFFSNGACDPSDHGEGERFLGSTTVTTDASSNATFNVNFPIAVLAGHFITTTATDPNNNTSEFSECALVTTVAAVTLSLTTLGTGSGAVTSSPAGIDCGADCTEFYPPTTVVTLTATADPGSVFGGWSGGGCNGAGTCTVTMDADKSVTATFDLETFTLTVTKAGSGSGTVIGSPSGINCGTDCTESYNSGTSVTLTATPDADSVFAGWSGGGCSGTSTCTVTMNVDTTVTATFNEPSTAGLTNISTRGEVGGWRRCNDCGGYQLFQLIP